jgi:hypothetical protein
MAKARKPRPTCPPPPGVPIDQTTGPLDFGGYDTPYRNMDERRPWVRLWEWLTADTPPRD